MRTLKRLLDILISLIGLIVAALPMLIIAAFVRAHMGSPVLFRQQRPGVGGKPFMMLKFRTMRDAVEKNGTPLPDGERITSLGNFLRRSSLDELPEFINVLKGDMSLVGPRPLLMQYLERYTPEQARRHEVKPGVTGWAQINGRNAISWDERFKLDVWYVDHWSFWLDIKILALSLVKVLKREGISADGHATMPEFTGNE